MGLVWTVAANGDRVSKHKSAYLVVSHETLMKSNWLELVSIRNLEVAEMRVKLKMAYHGIPLPLPLPFCGSSISAETDALQDHFGNTISWRIDTVDHQAALRNPTDHDALVPISLGCIQPFA